MNQIIKMFKSLLKKPNAMSEKKPKLPKLYEDEEGNVFKSYAFMIEDHHPVVGRILIVDGRKYKVLDDHSDFRNGTFIKPMTEDDEREIEEFDAELEELSLKLVDKVDIKKMILEQIKKKSSQEIKTGLYILKQEEKEIEIEHSKGCYHFKLRHKNLEFEFVSGNDVIDGYDRQ